MSQAGLIFFLRIGLLYAGFGLTLGFVQGGIGPVLVARGLPLEQAGFAMLLFLPIGLSFLWAPVIERHEAAGQRIGGWILAMQAIAAVLLSGIAFLEAAPLSLLFVLGFGATSALATMDIRLEAVVVRHVPDTARPLAAAIKIGTFTLGAVLGGGLLVAWFAPLGWQNAFLILALVLACGVPAAAVLPRVSGSRHAGFGPVWRQQGFPGHLLTVGLMLASCFLLFGMARVALVDLGYPLERIGLLVGTTAPLLALPVIPLTGLAVARFGSSVTFAVFRFLAVLTGLLWAVAALQDWLWLAVAASIAGMAALSGIYVFILSALLTWSEGDHPASSYAMLYGGGNLAAMLPMAGAGWLAAAIGWAGYYLCAVILFIAASRVFGRRISGFSVEAG